jgi:hypothetical protein
MLRRVIAWLLMALLITAFCLSGAAGAAGAATSTDNGGAPAGDGQPIAVAGLPNVLIYPPDLAVREKGGAVLKCSPSQDPWISNDDQLSRTVSDVESLLNEFAAYPNVRKVLQNIRIYVFPIEVFPAGVLGEPMPFSGVTLSSAPGDEIWVGVNARYVLPHELGHMLHYKLLGADGYDWSRIDAEGKAYLALKNYPGTYRLDAASQTELPWNQRIAEMFAEDVKAYFLDKYDIIWKNEHGVIDNNTEQYFDRLLSDPGIEIPEAGTSGSTVG